MSTYVYHTAAIVIFVYKKIKILISIRFSVIILFDNIIITLQNYLFKFSVFLIKRDHICLKT